MGALILALLLGACSGSAPEPVAAPPPGPPPGGAAAEAAPAGGGGAPVHADGITLPPAPATADGEGPPPDLRCRSDLQWSCAVPVPGGRARLGAQAADPAAPGYDPHALPEEAPVREVDVAPFWLLRTEVTAREHRKCVAAGACSADDLPADAGIATTGAPDADDLPVAGITRAGAERYCAWLGGRLPTEAEWELAARGEEGRRFPWGDAPLCPYRDDARKLAGEQRIDRVLATCGAPIERARAALGQWQLDRLSRILLEVVPEDALLETCRSAPPDPAGTAAAFQALVRRTADTMEPATCPRSSPAQPADLDDATPHGILGLAGNVAEWTSTAAEGGFVQKGGSFLSDDAWAWRSASRTVVPPDTKLPDVGFRCAW